MMLLNPNSIPKTLGVNNLCYLAKYFLYLLVQIKDHQNPTPHKNSNPQLSKQIANYEIFYLVIFEVHKVFNNKYAPNPSAKLKI